MHIRPATTLDRDAIRAVHLAAFQAGEAQLVAQLAIDLLAEDSTPETLSLVAEVEGAIVGHVAFSPISIDTIENYQGYILAPLGVKPGHQKHRIGSKLTESGRQQLARRGIDILFVYGDPAYYGRFGFSADAAAPFIPPYELQYPFGWQAKALKDSQPGGSPVKIYCVPALCHPELW